MESVGVRGGDSRDPGGEWRFHPLMPGDHLDPAEEDQRIPDWFNGFTAYPHRKGVHCCSSTAVSFHYVTPWNMHALDYFIYRLRPYGVSSTFPSLDLVKWVGQKPGSIGNNGDLILKIAA